MAKRGAEVGDGEWFLGLFLLLVIKDNYAQLVAKI